MPPKKRSLCCAHDNNAVFYQPKSSRSGIAASMLSSAMVWTMRELFEFGPKKKDAPPSIQFDPTLGPKTAAWKPKGTADPALTVYGYVSTASGIPEGTLTDHDYILKEVLASLLFVSEQEYFLKVPQLTMDNRPAAFFHVVAGLVPTAAESSLPVECLYCNEWNKKGTRSCVWCKNKLRCIDQVRSDLAGATLSVLAKKRRPPRTKRQVYDEVWGKDENGSVVRTKVRLNLHTLSCIVEGDIEDEYLDASDDGDGVEVERSLLPSLFVNPNTSTAIRAILAEWGAACNLAGFQDPGTHADLLRFFLFVVSDLGATDLEAFDDETPDKNHGGQDFRNFIYVLGVFHECKMWIGLVMDIFFSMGGGALAFFHTYMSEGAQAYLRRCGDLHKANDFLRHVVKPALFTAFLREYMFHLDVFNRDKSDEDKKEFSLIDAIQWGEDTLADDKCLDLNFKNRVFFLLRILPGP